MNTLKKSLLFILCATTLVTSSDATTTARRRDARIAGLLGLSAAGISIMNRVLENPSPDSFTKDVINGAIIVGLSGATAGLLYGTKDVPRMIKKPLLATIIGIIANNKSLLRFLSDNKGLHIFADTVTFMKENGETYEVRNNLGITLRILIPYMIATSLFANSDSETTLDKLEEQLEEAETSDIPQAEAMRETYNYLKNKFKHKSFLDSVKASIPFFNK